MDNGKARSSTDDQTTITSNAISTISDLAKHLSNRGDSTLDDNVNSSVVQVNSLPIRSSNSSPNQSKSFLDNQLSNDVVDVMPKVMEFNWFDVMLNLISIFCYLIDVVSDVVTCCVHYQTKNFVFFYLTLLFIIVPTLITTFISLRW